MGKHAGKSYDSCRQKCNNENMLFALQMGVSQGPISWSQDTFLSRYIPWVAIWCHTAWFQGDTTPDKPVVWCQKLWSRMPDILHHAQQNLSKNCPVLHYRAMFVLSRNSSVCSGAGWLYWQIKLTTRCKNHPILLSFFPCAMKLVLKCLQDTGWFSEAAGVHRRRLVALFMVMLLTLWCGSIAG